MISGCGADVSNAEIADPGMIYVAALESQADT